MDGVWAGTGADAPEGIVAAQILQGRAGAGATAEAADSSAAPPASSAAVILPKATQYVALFRARVGPDLAAKMALAGRKSFLASELRVLMATAFGLTREQLAKRGGRCLQHVNLTAHCLKRGQADGLLVRVGGVPSDGEYSFTGASAAAAAPAPVPASPAAAAAEGEVSMPEEDAPFDIAAAAKLIGGTLILPPETTLRALSDAMAGQALLLSGPASSGKTTLARLLPAALEAGGAGPVGWWEETMNAGTACYDLVGSCDIRRKWTDGPLTAAIRACPADGRMIFLVDEFGRFDQGGNLGPLMTMLAEDPMDRRLVLTGHPRGEVLKVPPGFVVVATANLSDGECARRMSPAVRTRFAEIPLEPPPAVGGMLCQREWEGVRNAAVASLFGGAASPLHRSLAEQALDAAAPVIRSAIGRLRAACPGLAGLRQIASACRAVASCAAGGRAVDPVGLAMAALAGQLVPSADATLFAADPELAERMEALAAEMPAAAVLFRGLADLGR